MGIAKPLCRTPKIKRNTNSLMSEGKSCRISEISFFGETSSERLQLPRVFFIRFVFYAILVRNSPEQDYECTTKEVQLSTCSNLTFSILVLLTALALVASGDDHTVDSMDHFSKLVEREREAVATCYYSNDQEKLSMWMMGWILSMIA